MIDNKSVLVVDDESSVRSVLVQMLRRHPGLAGWNILQAVDGNEAAEVFVKYRPALVLIDRDMPGRTETPPRRTGTEATVYIKTCVPGTKVIGMSGHTDAKEEFAFVGADGFILKPISPTTLYPIIAKLLKLQG